LYLFKYGKTSYSLSISKDNAAARRRLRRRIYQYVEEADDPGLRRGRLRQQS
jgi:hypothetical protein